MLSARLGGPDLCGGSDGRLPSRCSVHELGGVRCRSCGRCGRRGRVWMTRLKGLSGRWGTGRNTRLRMTSQTATCRRYGSMSIRVNADCEQDGGVSTRLFPRSTAACEPQHQQRQNLHSLLSNRPSPTSSPSGTRCVRATGRCCSVIMRAFTAPGASSPRRATPTAGSHTRWATRLFLLQFDPNTHWKFCSLHKLFAVRC